MWTVENGIEIKKLKVISVQYTELECLSLEYRCSNWSDLLNQTRFVFDRNIVYDSENVACIKSVFVYN